MFLIDKYGQYAEENTMYHYQGSNKDENLIFHHEALTMLRIMANDDSMPHIIFYGPEGGGKKTIIQKFLEMIYDTETASKTKNTIYQVTGSGNNVTDVMIKQSNYHIVIEPGNDNRDRYLIHDVVKEYARRRPLHNLFSAKKQFKTVVINNIGNLSYFGQTSLRRTMEKYSDTCRFVMWTHSLSQVIEPLRSRCFCFRVEPPSMLDIHTLIHLVCGHENLKIPLKTMTRIIDDSGGNIKKVLWSLDFWRHNYGTKDQYRKTIRSIVQLIVTSQLDQIQRIRDMLYWLIISNLKGTQIIMDLMEEMLLLPQTSIAMGRQIVEATRLYEHRVSLARRVIIQLDAYVIAMMKLFYEKKD